MGIAQEGERAAEKRASECRTEMEEMEESYEAEVARLRGELREAKGREQALQGVIAQWMSAQGVQRVHESRVEP